MESENTLRWVYELVDQFTGPIKDLVASSKEFEKQQADVKKAVMAPIKEVIAGQRGLRKEMGITARDLTGSAIQRAKLLRQEQAELRRLKMQQKAAFAPETIEAFNQKIAESKRRISTLKGEAGGLRGAFSNLNKVTGGLAGTFAGLFAINKLKNFVSSSLSFYDKQAQAEAQLRASLESTNYVAGKTFDELKKKASEFQENSVFGDEEILLAQANLLKYERIWGDTFDAATQAAMDMAAKVQGMNLDSAMDTIGKALNDPIEGLSMLQRQTGRFTKEQQANIEALVNSGRRQEAQMVILDALNQKFGGSAKAASEEGLGGWKQLSNMFGDIKEDIGEVTASLLKELMPSIKSFLKEIQGWTSWLKENPEQVKKLVGWIGKAAATIGVLIGVTKLWTIAQLALNIAMSANPVGMVIVAIGALIAAIAMVVIWFDEIVDWLKEFGHWLLALVNPFGLIAALIIHFWDDIKAFFKKMAHMVLDFVDNIIPGAKDAILGFAQKIIEMFEKVKEKILGIWSSIKGIFSSEEEPQLTVNVDVNTSGLSVEEWADEWKSASEDVRKKMLDEFNKKSGLNMTMEEANQRIENQLKAQSMGMTYAEYTSMNEARQRGGASAISEGLNSVTEAGKSRDVRNNNIRIEKLVERIEITAATVSESKEKIKEMITQALVDAVRDSEIALS